MDSPDIKETPHNDQLINRIEDALGGKGRKTHIYDEGARLVGEWLTSLGNIPERMVHRDGEETLTGVTELMGIIHSEIFDDQTPDKTGYIKFLKSEGGSGRYPVYDYEYLIRVARIAEPKVAEDYVYAYLRPVSQYIPAHPGIESLTLITFLDNKPAIVGINPMTNKGYMGSQNTLKTLKFHVDHLKIFKENIEDIKI